MQASASTSRPSPTTDRDQPRESDWSPNPGPQTRFLATTANEVLYGGAAGGGKSAAIISLPLRWAHHPHFRALVLRRETTQLVDLLDKAAELWPKAFPGLRYNGTTRTWVFPSGATIRFNHCEHDRDADQYDGHEFQLVEFDELAHFSERQYRAIRARIRSSKAGLPRYTRSTTNPPREGDDGRCDGRWVFQRWGAWLDPNFEAPGLEARTDDEGARMPPALPGQVLWYLPSAGGEVYVPKGTEGALSRQFIPARLSDNPRLLANDPGYVQQLMDLDPVRRAQLLDGDWLIRPAAGLYWKRGWVEFLDAAPAGAARVRAWDLAATRATPGRDPDWTVGYRVAWTQPGVYVVEDVVRLRGSPGEVDALIEATAELDGQAVRIVVPQDPGQAGKSQVAHLISRLAGFSVRSQLQTGDKITRFGPASSQAEAGNFRFIRGAWNEQAMRELEGFPTGAHDDDADALSSAVAELTSKRPPTDTTLIRLPSRR